MINFKIAESDAINMSNKIVSAVSNATGSFFRAQKANPDKYTPEIEKEFAALMWRWQRIANEISDLDCDTAQFFYEIESEDDNAGD